MSSLYALQHRTCGHISGAANNRALIEHRRAHLQAGGYYQWRVRIVNDEKALTELVEGVVCDTCRIDPARGLLLHDEAGKCKVCAA